MPFNKWQISVLNHQNALLPGQRREVNDPIFVWCPVVKDYLPASEVTVMHIIPSAMEFYSIAYQFGLQDDKKSDKQIIKSKTNGLVMCRGLREKFMRGEFVLIPVEHESPVKGQSLMKRQHPTTDQTAVENNLWRLRLVLLNDIIGLCPIRGSSRRFSDVNHTELVFKGDGGPDLRCLYWHYFVSILKAEKKGWLTPLSMPKWVIRGPLIRAESMEGLLCAFGSDFCMGNFGMGASGERFTEGQWKGVKSNRHPFAIAQESKEALAKDESEHYSDEEVPECGST